MPNTFCFIRFKNNLAAAVARRKIIVLLCLLRIDLLEIESINVAPPHPPPQRFTIKAEQL